MGAFDLEARHFLGIAACQGLLQQASVRFLSFSLVPTPLQLSLPYLARENRLILSYFKVLLQHQLDILVRNSCIYIQKNNGRFKSSSFATSTIQFTQQPSHLLLFEKLAHRTLLFLFKFAVILGDSSISIGEPALL